MQKYDFTYKAIADQIRRQIIIFLKERDLSAGEIASKFKISKPSISHHLNILKQSGLITNNKQGKNIIYSLNQKILREFIEDITERYNSRDKNGKK